MRSTVGKPVWASGATAPLALPTEKRRMTEESDEALMLQVGRGNERACREIVARHLGRIVAVAGRMLGDPVEAEDVAQEVFLRVWTHARQWRPEARLTTWLHRVALNLCADRRKTPRTTRAVAWEHVDEPADPTPGGFDRVRQQEIGHQVSRALETLSEQQRRAIVLCHYQGFRNQEAAEIMETSIEAIESLLVRGRRRMRATLRDVAPEILGDG